MDKKFYLHYHETSLVLSPAVGQIIKAAALPNHPSDILCINRKHELWRINSISGCSHIICALQDLKLSEKSIIQIQISPCLIYAAITRIDYDESSNQGFIINLQKGEAVFELKDFGYYAEQADFPIVFFHRNECCHFVYASDWNTLDIINLETGECLTARNDDEITESQRDDCLFTEWSGELKISPDGKRIATMGWMWHPVGIIWNFSLENWLTNKWEADFGRSKMQLGEVNGIWHSSFAWLDNERIIIWGDPETEHDRDAPENNAVIYNVITGKKLFYFDGPTIDIFEIDGSYLFTGKADGKGINVWNWETGNLVSEYVTDHSILTYLPCSKTFIARDNKQQLRRLTWAEKC